MTKTESIGNAFSEIFVIRASSFIRHSSFDIRHFYHVNLS
jgi:hypothetical protein